MSDPEQIRPVLPDPQRDRHVAFAEDVPSRATATPSGTLPPEAWAPRAVRRDPSSPAFPYRQGPQPAPVPSIPATPASRAEPRRRRRRWLALLFVPMLLHGIANDGGSASSESGSSMTEDCTPSSGVGAGPGGSDCSSLVGDGTGSGGMGNAAPGVYAMDVTASSKPLAPLLGGSPKVAPVPADTALLRVEIVSSEDHSSLSHLETRVDTTADGVLIDASEQGTPQVLELHLGRRPADLKVTVTVTAGLGNVQCRAYAGSTLVALDTSGTVATCSPAL